MGHDVIVPSPERIKADVQHLKGWIAKEPHLPKITDEEWLETFLHHNKFSLEKTKCKLDKYYTLRSKYPEILRDRDPCSEEMSRCRKTAKFAIMEPPRGRSLWVYFGKCDANANAFDMRANIKRMTMFLDLLLLKKEGRHAKCITIIDFRDIRYLHVLKFLSQVAKLAEIFDDAYTERIEACHLINVPAFAYKPIELAKKFFPRKLNERICIHTASKNTLFETVDRDYVCSDFGGNAPSLAKLEERTQEELEKYRKWFKEQDNVCAVESLRRRGFDEMEELKGSFRKLEVD